MVGRDRVAHIGAAERIGDPPGGAIGAGALHEHFEAARVAAQRIQVARAGRWNHQLAVHEARIVERLEGKVAVRAVVVFGADAGARRETLFHGGQQVIGADGQQAAAAQGRGQKRNLGILHVLSETELKARALG